MDKNVQSRNALVMLFPLSLSLDSAEPLMLAYFRNDLLVWSVVVCPGERFTNEETV